MTEAESLLTRALARGEAAVAARRPIDYARMNRILPRQKAALTRALNAKDRDKVILACRDAVKVWDEIGAWPDDWARWQRALSDVLPWSQQIDLEDLREGRA